MGKSVTVDIGGIGNLASIYKNYDKDLRTSFRQESRQIENELQAVIRKYADYSSVVSKANRLKQSLHSLEQEAASIGKRAYELGDRLMQAKQLYTSQEQEARQLAGSSSLKSEHAVTASAVKAGRRTGNIALTGILDGPEKIGSVVTNLGGGIFDAAGDVLGKLGRDALSLGGNVLDGIGDAAGKAGDVICDIGEGLLDGVTSLAGGAFDAAADIGSSLLDGISSAAESAADTALDIGSGLLSGIGGMAEQIGGAAADIGEAVLEAGSSLFSTIKETAGGVAVKVGDFVQDKWNDLKENFWNYASDITNCIVNWIDESPLVDFISQASEKILYTILDINKGPMKALDLFNTYIGLDHVPFVESVADTFGFGYDEKQGIFYTKLDAWQRQLGYFDVYDDCAALVGMPIDCEPIRFEYGGKEWKIELWKGQYYGSTGCEIGVYTDEYQFGVFDENTNDYLNENIDFGGDNNCATDSQLLEMDFTLYKNGEELFHSRDRKEGESEAHWWETGFKPGIISKASELTMDVSIKFDNEEMAKAFVEGLSEAGYTVEGSDAEVERIGSMVKFEFDEPKVGH